MYSGIAASCAATETIIMAGMLISYSTPKSQLPKNQNTPKAHSKMPYPVARLVLGTMLVTAAFKIDSWAPIPTPHSAIPRSSMGTLWVPKTKTAKGAESSVDQTSARIPFLSKSTPKKRAETASTSMAPAYRSGKVPLLTRAEVSASPAAIPV